jgi:hypothetical protein
MARSTVYWQRQERVGTSPRLRPIGPYADEELVCYIRTRLQAAPCHVSVFRDQEFAHVCTGDGSRCAERFIRTLKDNLLWYPAFQTAEGLRLALFKLQQCYNET